MSATVDTGMAELADRWMRGIELAREERDELFAAVTRCLAQGLAEAGLSTVARGHALRRLRLTLGWNGELRIVEIISLANAAGWPS